MKFAVRQAASDDILRQYRYYLNKDARAAAERFIEAVRHTIDQVCRRPGIGTSEPLKNPALAGLRSWRIEGFPAIRVYYLVSDNALRVVRVLHSKRDINPLLEDESADE